MPHTGDVSHMNQDSSINALIRIFESSWEPMVALMNRARAVEFKIRLTAEVLSQKTFSQVKTFDEFMGSARKAPRKKMEKHIKDIFGDEQQKFILIRQCADSLAHADYIAARRRINQYHGKYGLTTEINDQTKGLIFYENVKHPDGEIAGVGYLLNTSDENLILEEFEVFKHQGYLAASEEMLSFSENRLNEIMPKLNVKYASLVTQRGLKYGTRQQKND